MKYNEEDMEDDLFGEDDEDQEDTMKDKFLTFAVDDEEYGIEIRDITEIIRIQKITDIPDVPHYIKGVINLRGKVIPVIDIRKRFNIHERTYNDRTCIVVITTNGTDVGMIVDTVSDVVDIPENELEPAPRVKKSKTCRFIKALGKIGDAVKIILDTEKLLYDENSTRLADSSQYTM